MKGFLSIDAVKILLHRKDVA